MSESPHELIAVCGLPGVGKSTVSSFVAEQTDSVRLRTDVIRKELVEEPTYSESEDERVYAELFDRAEKHLSDRVPVVLDATFADRQRRHAVRQVANAQDVQFRLLRVVCTQEVAEHRIASREDISDADVSVYREFQEQFDPIELEHDSIDNSESLARTRSQVESLF